MVAFEILFACFLAMLSLAVSVLTTFYSKWVQDHYWMVYVGWGCGLGSIMFLVAAIVQWRRASSRLTIHWALWCGDDPKKFEPKTKLIRDQIRNNSIEYHVHQDQLGDVFKGETKKLRVMYSLGEIQHREITIVNGEYLIIPEPFEVAAH